MGDRFALAAYPHCLLVIVTGVLFLIPYLIVSVFCSCLVAGVRPLPRRRAG